MSLHRSQLTLTFFFFICLLFPPATALAEGPVIARDDPSLIRLVVGVAEGSDAPDLAVMSAEAGARPVLQDASLQFMTLEVSRDAAQTLVKQLKSDRRVRYVEQDSRVYAALMPDDPDFNNPSKVYGPQHIGAPAAWDVTAGDSSIIIAVLDTGLDASHPEFSGRIVQGTDIANHDDDPGDDHGHGTHVAGIAAAAINNGLGIAGIAGQAQIMAVKVLDAGAVGWWSDVAQGIHWATDHGARVINLSLSGSVNSQALIDAINYAYAHDVLIVAAAGNDSTNQDRFPATLEHVLSVGATDFNRQRWALSNYGPNVDIMAPGATIYSTYPLALSASGYRFMSGTSMATPHVTGVVALMLSANPALTPDDLTSIIENSAEDLGAAGYDEYYGHGLIDAESAVLTAAGLLPPTPEATVSPTITPTPTSTPTPTTTPVCSSSLDGHLYRDLNSNGIREEGEPGIAGITVALVDPDSHGIVVTTSTDGAGNYHFENLSANSYLIDIDQYELWQAGDYLTTGNEPLLMPPPPCGPTQASPIGFGPYTGPGGVVGGRVWSNEVEGGAQPLRYHQVVLCDRQHTLILASSESDAFGLYSFDGLAAGIYLVETAMQSQPASAGDAVSGDSNPITVAVRLTQGESNLAIDVSDASTAAIGGFLFLDGNGNGRLDPAESQAIAGGVVTMTNVSTQESFSTISDNAGNYLFSGVITGTYTISVGAVMPGLALTSARSLEVTVGATGVYALADFGYIAPTAVSLESFLAIQQGTEVVVEWSTSNEENQSGFRIWRASSAQAKYKPVSEFIMATGKASGARYKWLDKSIDARSPSVSYKLQSLPDGAFYGPISTNASSLSGTLSQVFIVLVQR